MRFAYIIAGTRYIGTKSSNRFSFVCMLFQKIGINAQIPAKRVKKQRGFSINLSRFKYGHDGLFNNILYRKFCIEIVCS